MYPFDFYFCNYVKSTQLYSWKKWKYTYSKNRLKGNVQCMSSWPRAWWDVDVTCSINTHIYILSYSRIYRNSVWVVKWAEACAILLLCIILHERHITHNVIFHALYTHSLKIWTRNGVFFKLHVRLSFWYAKYHKHVHAISRRDNVKMELLSQIMA